MRSVRDRCFSPDLPIYYIGLDLGQAQDFSAVALIERMGDPPIYRVLDLYRFPLGTSYPEIVDRISNSRTKLDITPNLLVVDGTGVGRPVVDLFKRAGLHLVPVVIHGGDNYTYDVQARVPKRDLVGILQILLQSQRLKIAGCLREAEILVEELLNIRVKISDAGKDSYGVWREGMHDDYVLALAIACWVSERGILPRGLHWPRPRSNNRSGYRGRMISLRARIFSRLDNI